MRLALIQLFFVHSALRQHCQAWQARTREMGTRACWWLLRRCHYRYLFTLARLMVNPGQRQRNAVANANARSLLGSPNGLNYGQLASRRWVLEQAATLGNNPALREEIDRCAALLRRQIAAFEQAGQPVILAPIHSLSDIVAVVVGARATGKQLTVVVSSNADAYSRQTRACGGLDNIDYCSIHSSSQDRASQLIDHTVSAQRGERHFLIFPDMTTEYARQASSDAMGTLPCRLFKRPARLHSGIIRMARLIKAPTVFYQLYYQDGLKIAIDPPVPHKALAAALPVHIELAIRRHPTDWLLWHQHSLFFYND